MAVTRKDIGHILVETGVITQDELSQAQDVQRSAPGDIGRIVIDLGFVDGKEREVTKARAEVMGFPYVDLSTTKVDQAATNLVPEHIAKKYTIIPFKKDGASLSVAAADPNNPHMPQDLRIVTGCQIKLAMALEDDILDAIRRSYKAGEDSGKSSPLAPTAGDGAQTGVLAASLKEAIASYGSKEISADEEDTGALQEAAQEAPIIRIVNAIITQAIRDGATDIHVEPDRRGMRIRYRIDGVLHETMSVPKYIQAPLVSRLKIMAEMDIAERRVPQDGRIGVRTGDGKDYDLRVSALPTVHGEKVVMRILDKTSVLLGLNKLGFTPELQAQVEELTNQPNGLVLSTGPTGSGKTTTQYSVLHRLNSIERNIITIEDPVEYQLSGIAQVAVNKKAGLTFGNALRSFLRQDPDIIMVGEMRDLETAEIAIEASLTGHLVLSTLHTNDSPSAVIRMVDMGVEPYLISATVIGVLAQRLARRICQNCKTTYTVPAKELRRFGFKPDDPNQEVTLFRGTGCETCRDTGYKGRIGIYELMRMNDEIAELVVRRVPLADVREAAKANGMHELREDGLMKVLEGITTPDEVMRVVFTAGH